METSVWMWSSVTQSRRCDVDDDDTHVSDSKRHKNAQYANYEFNKQLLLVQLNCTTHFGEQEKKLFWIRKPYIFIYNYN